MSEYKEHKKGKSLRLTHGQVLGMIWIMAALMLMVAVAIFTRTLTPSNGQSTTPAPTLDNRSQPSASPSPQVRYKTSASTPQATATSPAQTVNHAHSEQSVPPPATPYRRQTLVVELNSADSITLQLLHGIGPAFARRIVNYRERLGGFVSTDQLLEVYGLSPERLEPLLPHIIIDPTKVTKLQLNQLELKQLLRHPYMEYYVARDIIALRRQGITLNGLDDLRALPSMTDSTFLRLQDYVAFE